MDSTEVRSPIISGMGPVICWWRQTLQRLDEADETLLMRRTSRHTEVHYVQGRGTRGSDLLKVFQERGHLSNDAHDKQFGFAVVEEFFV